MALDLFALDRFAMASVFHSQGEATASWLEWYR
jgi:hypothetical protein